MICITFISSIEHKILPVWLLYVRAFFTQKSGHLDVVIIYIKTSAKRQVTFLFVFYSTDALACVLNIIRNQKVDQKNVCMHEEMSAALTSSSCFCFLPSGVCLYVLEFYLLFLYWIVVVLMIIEGH